MPKGSGIRRWFLMNKAEMARERAKVRKMARAISSFYPESKLDLSNDLDAEMWAAAFFEVEESALLDAVVSHFKAGNRFPPNAGELFALCGPKGASINVTRIGGDTTRPGKDDRTRNALANMARFVLDNLDEDDCADLPTFCARYLGA